MRTEQSPDLAGLEAGHDLAWRRLVARHQPRMIRQARSLLRNSEEANEAVQAVWLRLWRSRRTLGQVRSFDRYLLAAVRNEARNRLRSKRREGHTRDPLAGETEWAHRDGEPSGGLEHAELRVALDRLANRLTPKQRAVLRLLAEDPDQSARRIAARLRCSHKNVLAILWRIRRSARQMDNLMG